MLYRLFQALFGGVIGWFSDRLEAKASERVIQEEQTTIEQKRVEAKTALDDLDKLGVLKTTAATGIKEQEAKVAEDDKAVADAEVKVQQAKDVAVQVKPSRTDVTADELAEEMKDL